MFPEKYNKEQYILWHELTFRKDIKLEEKIIDLREKLKSELRDDLKYVTNLIYTLISYCDFEYQKQNGHPIIYNIPLSEILTNNLVDKYELIFKSTDSIINKLWRKNKINPIINLDNIGEHITDLVRTEIICNSLATCSFISNRFSTDFFRTPMFADKTEEIFSVASNFHFEPEMKMASGYFAYHGLIKLTKGYSIEIQIYSTLMSVWRNISHKLYESVRINPTTTFEFGTSESRLISLGHLLHLAECEVERLEKEIK